ncbi:unnamed protein product [Sphagnum troendelagicum]|uniref:Uncharacterized protein n=1 Tax=Sphagnum troendelagicum TaxID=128251 RepID=A0ABP0UGH9_9BRYO
MVAVVIAVAAISNHNSLLPISSAFVAKPQNSSSDLVLPCSSSLWILQLEAGSCKSMWELKRYEWNLQIGGIARGLGAWQVLVLNQFRLLSATVTVIFFRALDWMANGGGIEALLLGSCGHLLSSKY